MQSYNTLKQNTNYLIKKRFKYSDVIIFLT